MIKSINNITDDVLFSIITVCKNRLDHLKQTLPEMVKQKNCEVIVVDYNCPQNTDKWVKENFEEVKVVKLFDNKEFCVAKGRNEGAKIASGKYLFFVDADILLYGNFYDWIIENCNSNGFYQVENYKNSSMYGTAIIPKDIFSKIKGYDEAFVGWGGEDNDLYFRLTLNRFFFPKGYIDEIKHEDNLRQFGNSKELMLNKEEGHKVNSLYRKIKYDLINLLKIELDINARIDLMNIVKNQIKKQRDSKDVAKIEINLSSQKIKKLYKSDFYNLNQTLIYKID